MLIMELCLGVAVNCDATQEIIGNFTERLPQEVLEDLMLITQDVIEKYGKLEPDDEEEEDPEEAKVDLNEGTLVIDGVGRSESNEPSPNVMDPHKRHDGKALADETELDLNQTYYAAGDDPNRSRALDRSAGKTEGNRSRVIGGTADISIDQEYLGRIDDIE